MQIDNERLAHIHEKEAGLFASRRPRSAELAARGAVTMPDAVPMAWMAALHRHSVQYVVGGNGSRFWDVDGNELIDFNLADLSNTAGYGDNPAARAVAAQAAKGMQFLLPTEDSVVVSELLSDRTGMPSWQYTLSASSANTETIRIARAMTGHRKIVLFEGKYHGHLDATMAEGGQPNSNQAARPEAMGLSPREAAEAINVRFNDPEDLRRALQNQDIALVLLEPALTNCSLVLPTEGFLERVIADSQAAGALVALDETHTWQMAYGGFTRQLNAKPDFVTLGKGLGSGIALGAYGMATPVASFVESHRDGDFSPTRGLALGGTTFANALSLAAARAMLTEVATPEAYARIEKLGLSLANGIESLIAEWDLPWRAFRYGPRSGFCLTATLPLNYAEAKPSVNSPLSDAKRVFMANRGIWDAIATAGPQISFAHSQDDVDRYLEVAAEFLGTLCC